MKKIYGVCLLCLLGACQTLPTSSEWLARGDGYFRDGNLPKALHAYNQAVKLNPNHAAVYASRGAAFFFAGDYASAQEDFVEVLKINPYQANAYTALASAVAAQGDYTTALTLVNQALLLTPDKPEVFFTRGGINFMLGKYDQAVQDYSMVLQMRPAADVYNARGAAYLQMGKEKEAQQDFDKAKSGTVPAKLNDYRMID